MSREVMMNRYVVCYDTDNAAFKGEKLIEASSSTEAVEKFVNWFTAQSFFKHIRNYSLKVTHEIHNDNH
jgi:hypothetical protein